MGSVKYGASSRVSAGEGRASSQPGLKYDVRHTLDENSLRMLDKQLKNAQCFAAVKSKEQSTNE